MQPSKNQTLTPLELEIMQVLWQVGTLHGSRGAAEATGGARLYHGANHAQRTAAQEKVKRAQEGRAYRYRPAVSRERATGTALSDLVKRMFGGSSEALLMAMVDTQQISAEELARVAQRLAAAENSANREHDGRSNDGASDSRVHSKRPLAGSPSCRRRMVVAAGGQARAADTAWGMAGCSGTGSAAAPPWHEERQCTSPAANNYRSYIEERTETREVPSKP